MSANYETIELSTDSNGIAHLTINRPKKLNALNNAVLDELDRAFDQIAGDKAVKGVVLNGSGDKAFVAGADISELSGLNRESGTAASEKGQQIFQKIESSSKPVIAVVDGYALGGGTELALSAHMRVGTPNAVFGLPEVSLGLIPGYGGTQRMTKLIGQARAADLILTGRQIKAEEALNFGLLNRVDEDADSVAEELLKKIFKNGPVAVSGAIEAIHAADSTSGFKKESEIFGKLCETEDFKEGTSAFLEKRKPDFKGK
ncbi:enoyl-CoA hydratase [Rhodohalobacter sp. SW132]|uniref:enoyl-CoA hydratase/isomerase family protein n=1 Tax=Rhodohalobacter sp. SW132 TaxID=2293433 RepID=UPI000E25547D|nr:enoyl-CoA hydratase-related protein [Rhodohalobacter sp. SW132]REL24970.1 enoyl-CoA hydratase [Rhodohalobacter sp. SW132]